MRELDEATTAAVAGEVPDARFVELICCHLIDACKRVRAFDRAREWCQRVEEIAVRLGDTQIFTLCRNYYGEVLVWRGAWNEAELAFAAASRELTRKAEIPRTVLASPSFGGGRGDSRKPTHS